MQCEIIGDSSQRDRIDLVYVTNSSSVKGEADDQ